jgi:Zn-dependent protease
MENSIQTLAISILPLVFAITLHEAAHGYVARHFGDATAWQLGRVSLNPLRHIDPLGTVAIPALMMLAGSGMLFGWAKPVPVNFSRLRDPKRDMLWVAAAGPGANFAMALGWGLMLKLATIAPHTMYSDALREMSRAGININVILMLLNLVPVPPLDGGRIAVSLLPTRAALQYARVEPFGIFIVLALLFAHVLDVILYPLVGLVMMVIRAIFQF